MSGLETLSPDQRAVLQLILTQGRGYDELADLLQIERDSVRTRALAGLDALAPDGELTPEQRGRIGDYLLGQQDDGERIVTLAELGASEPAARWARTLHERLAALAHAPLPGVPAANGHTPPPPPPAAAQPAEPPAPAEPAEPPAAAQPAEPPAPAAPAAPAADAPTPPPEPPADAPAATRPPSRLGGAILLVVAVVAIAVVAVVLLTRDDDAPPASQASTTPAQQQTQPAGNADADIPPVLGQANLNAPAGGRAQAVGLISSSDAGELVLVLEAQRVPPNGRGDAYALWLRGRGRDGFLGYIARPVTGDGRFSAVTGLPANTRRRYSEVLLTRESTTSEQDTPSRPGPVVMGGPITWR